VTPSALFNGQEPSGGWDATRALHYGDGVFRSVLIHDGACVDWPQHLRKLRSDAEALGLEMPERALLDAEATALVADRKHGVLKVILSRCGERRGYRPDAARADRLLQWHPLPAYPAKFWDEGVTVGWSELRLSAQPRLAGIKHLNRLEQVLASREIEGEVAEVLMCDEEDHPICGTRSNLFVVRDGCLHTPDLNRQGVAGLMRGRILDTARNQGLAVHVDVLTRQQVVTADECFLSNAIIGIWAVRRLGEHEWNSRGPATSALVQSLNHPCWYS
jgi:4-amino-4-deoxychorismate lyase